ncbi:MAG TPA: DUF503 domain-containing protein [bacterium]|nr:DUF503 domain-containing protein [bacterium]
MVVAVLRVELSLPGSHSLKDKRRVVKSLLDRLHNEFNVSAAEVAYQENHRHAALAVGCVSGQAAHANAVLSRVLDVVQREAELVITGVEMEMR